MNLRVLTLTILGCQVTKSLNCKDADRDTRLSDLVFTDHLIFHTSARTKLNCGRQCASCLCRVTCSSTTMASGRSAAQGYSSAMASVSAYVAISGACSRKIKWVTRCLWACVRACAPVCVCVCARARARVCACVCECGGGRTCLSACVRARARACVCVRVCMSVCVCVSVFMCERVGVWQCVWKRVCVRACERACARARCWERFSCLHNSIQPSYVGFTI